MISKKSFAFKQSLHYASNKYFSKHSKLIIIGAGTGGVTTAKQLAYTKVYNKTDITIFDPSKLHYYQPGFTKVAGIPDFPYNTNNYPYNKIVFDTQDLTKEFNFQNTGIKEVDPDNQTIIDANGEKWTYDQLVISCGIQVKLDSIPGFYKI